MSSSQTDALKNYITAFELVVLTMINQDLMETFILLAASSLTFLTDILLISLFVISKGVKSTEYILTKSWKRYGGLCEVKWAKGFSKMSGQLQRLGWMRLGEELSKKQI